MEIIPIFAGFGFGIFAFVIIKKWINALQNLLASEKTGSIYMTLRPLDTLEPRINSGMEEKHA